MKGELKLSKATIVTLEHQESTRQQLDARNQGQVDELTSQMKRQAQVISDAYQRQVLALQEELRQAAASQHTTSVRTAELEAEIAILKSDPNDGSRDAAITKNLYELRSKLSASEDILQHVQDRLGEALELNMQLTYKADELSRERDSLKQQIDELTSDARQLESLRSERDALCKESQTLKLSKNPLFLYKHLIWLSYPQSQ